MHKAAKSTPPFGNAYLPMCYFSEMITQKLTDIDPQLFGINYVTDTDTAPAPQRVPLCQNLPICNSWEVSTGNLPILRPICMFFELIRQELASRV